MAFFFTGLFSRSRRRRQVARKRLAWTAVTLVGLGAMAMAATAYSRLYVFGESLTETANLLAATGIGGSPAPSGNFAGNDAGALAYIEDLAAHLGVQANPSASGGTNYAFGGALNDIDGVLPEGFALPSLAQQIQNYLTANGGEADPDGLYVVQGGAGAAGAAGQLGNAGAQNITFGTAQNFTTLPFEDSQAMQFAGLTNSGGPGNPPGNNPPCEGEACTQQQESCVGEACNQPPPCTGEACNEQQCTDDCGPPLARCEQGSPTCLIPDESCPASECGAPEDDTTPTNLPSLIAQDVPEPATIVVVVAALGMLTWMRGLPVVRVRRRED